MQVLRRELLIPFLVLLAALGLAACDGGEVPLGGVPPDPNEDPEDPAEEPPQPGQLRIRADDPYGLGGQVRLNWGVNPTATFYRLYRSFGNIPVPDDDDDPHEHAGYEQLGEDVPAPPAGAPSMTFGDILTPHLTPWRSVRYLLEACNVQGCTDSRDFFMPVNSHGVIAVTSRHDTNPPTSSVVGRGEPREPRDDARLGSSIVVSRDGNTIVVGASGSAEGDSRGAAHVFVRGDDGFSWTERARLTAADAAPTVAYAFGHAVASSDNGGTVAIGAPDAPAGGFFAAGRVYVFSGDGDDWTEQAVLSAPNPAQSANFGSALALSTDGNTLIVGAPLEDGGPNGDTGVSPAPTGSPPAVDSGAVYVYTRSGSNWTLTNYIKARAARPASQFGASVALSRDGSTLAVGAAQDRSAVTGIDGDMVDDCDVTPEGDRSNCAFGAGAVHVYTRDGGSWTPQAYIKGSNTEAGDEFGAALALSASGDDLLIGAPREDSVGRYGQDDLSSPEVQENNDAMDAGAVYLFRRAEPEDEEDTLWKQRVYLKASNTLVNTDPSHGDLFGSAVSIADGGSLLVVGAPLEGGRAIGIGGDHTDVNNFADFGAAYVYDLSSGFFSYIKETRQDVDARDNRFGWAVSLSGNGRTLAIGAPGNDQAWGPLNAEIHAGTVSASHVGTENTGPDRGVFYVY